MVFLHLSDIHFHRGISGSPTDLDLDLRNELERDAKGMIPAFGGIDGILITGDIAFAAKPEEYTDTEGNRLSMLQPIRRNWHAPRPE